MVVGTNYLYIKKNGCKIKFWDFILIFLCNSNLSPHTNKLTRRKREEERARKRVEEREREEKNKLEGKRVVDNNVL